MRTGIRTLLLLLACLVGVHSTAWAQAAIAGIVRDTSGAVLPGVTVEATSLGFGLAAVAVSVAAVVYFVNRE